jgi:hypothetical protein
MAVVPITHGDDATGHSTTSWAFTFGDIKRPGDRSYTASLVYGIKVMFLLLPVIDFPSFAELA